jgi:hypothetical protein
VEYRSHARLVSKGSRSRGSFRSLKIAGERGEHRFSEDMFSPSLFIPKTHGRERDDDISGRSEQILKCGDSMVS